MKQDIINYLTGKSILILGYGREGKSALNFIQQNLPDANLAIADQKALDLVNVKTFSGENYLEHVKEFNNFFNRLIPSFLPESHHWRHWHQRQKHHFVTNLPPPKRSRA